MLYNEMHNNINGAGGVVGAIPHESLVAIFYKTQEGHACPCSTPEASYSYID